MSLLSSENILKRRSRSAYVYM